MSLRENVFPEGRAHLLLGSRPCGHARPRLALRRCWDIGGLRRRPWQRVAGYALPGSTGNPSEAAPQALPGQFPDEAEHEIPTGG